MENNEISILALADGFPTRSYPAVVSKQYGCATPLQHWRTVRIEIRSSHVARTANHGFVVALRAAATQIKGNKEVKIPRVMHDEWRFNRLPIPRQSWRIRWWIRRPLASCQRIQFGVPAQEEPGSGVNAPHLDSRPETAKRQPGSAFRI